MVECPRSVCQFASATLCKHWKHQAASTLSAISISFALLLVWCPIVQTNGRPMDDANATQQQQQLHEREFVSPQARIQLDCHRDKTVIRVNFTKPFNGVLGAGQPDSTKCKLAGTGQRYYELQVSHNATDDCGAKWDSNTSSIVNTLFVRFHQSLETGADISKNVLCRLSVGDLVVGRRPNSSRARQRQQRRIIKAAREQLST